MAKRKLTTVLKEKAANDKFIAEQLEKTPKKEPPLQHTPQRHFKKIIISDNTTMYKSDGFILMHYKNDPTGSGGASMRLCLEDGTIEDVVGPFAASAKEIEEFLIN